MDRVRSRFPAAVRQKPYRNRETFVHVLYGEELDLHLRLPDRPDAEMLKAAGDLTAGPIGDVRRLVECVGRLERLGHEVKVYPDAEELIQRRLFQQHLAERTAEIQKDPHKHPLRKELLKVELLPYQLEGVAFAAGTGRAILADDMGLGKTIQGVGAAELLAREAGIRRVLVVCPASLKSQWRSEIHRFCDRSVQLVVGGAAERAGQYDSDCFFTVCNYEQVLRDILAIERTRWDLIVLDEGQRIKNWESKTARVIKGLKSPFALVLSRHAAGEPARRSVLRGAVRRRPAAAARPSASSTAIAWSTRRERCWATRTSTCCGRTSGRSSAAAPASRCCSSCRRGRTEIVRIPPTDEQLELHGTHMRIVLADRPQTLHQRDGPAAAAKGAADVPHGGRRHLPGGQAAAGLFQQAGVPGRAAGRAVRRAGLQGAAVLRVDHDARPDRAPAGQPRPGLRAAGRLRAAEGATADCQPLLRRTRAAGCSSPPTPARRA